MFKHVHFDSTKPHKLIVYPVGICGLTESWSTQGVVLVNGQDMKNFKVPSCSGWEGSNIGQTSWNGQ